MILPLSYLQNRLFLIVFCGISLLLVACAGDNKNQDPTPEQTNNPPSNDLPDSTAPTSCFTDGAFIISNLSVPQTIASQPYEIRTLDVNQNVLVDRSFIFVTIPAEFTGLDYILTANADKLSNENDVNFLSFDVNKTVDVYVSLDNRISQPPAWMSDWANTGRTIVDSDVTRTVYHKDFTSCTVALGGNGGNNDTSMYSVIVRATEANTPPVSPAPSAINDNASTTENLPVTVPVLDNDLNLGNTADITVTLLTAPINGTTMVEANQSITYTPNSGYSGSDKFDYQLSDTQNRTDSATVNIQISCLQCATSRSVSLSWTTNPLAELVSGYRIYYGDSATTANKLLNDIAINRANFNPQSPSITYNAGTDLSLKFGDTVCFKVAAYNIAGESDFSQVVCSPTI